MLDARRAARREAAARREVDEVGHQPGITSSSSLIWPSIGRPDEPLGVGVLRVAEQRAHVGLLDDLAGVHDGHPIGHLGHHAQVVGDEDDRGARSRWRSRIRSRICAWMVTSSAVVGSSAISSSGSRPAPWRSSRAVPSRPTSRGDRPRAGVPGLGCPPSRIARAPSRLPRLCFMSRWISRPRRSGRRRA